MPRLNLAHVRELDVPVCSPNEQRRIVAKIEELFSDLDAGVAALERAKANLKRYRSSVLKAAVEGRLTASWRAEHSPKKTDLSFLAAENRSTLAKRTKKGGRLWGAGVVPELTPAERASIPAMWQWFKVRDLGVNSDEVVQVGPMSMKSSEFEETGVPVLNVGCVHWDDFDETKLDYLPSDKARAFDRYRIAAGDVLFTRSGTVGRCAVAEDRHHSWLMTFHLLRVRTDRRACNPRYLRVVFEGAEHIRRQRRAGSVGSTRAGFNTKLLENLDVPVPTIDEQEAILERVDELLDVANRCDQEIGIELKRASRLRQSILKRAFEGKLVPQDPQDEPASTLLARIQAQRTAGDGAPAGPRKKKQTAKSKQPE